MALAAKTPTRILHLAMALGVVLLWVPLELLLAYFAWDVHYEHVAETQGMLTESDYQPEIERAAWHTVWVLVAAEMLAVVAVWWWVRRRSR